MAGVSASGKRETKRKGAPRGKPFEPGNPHRIKPGQVLNPEGKTGATTLSGGYKKMLAMQPPEAMRAKMAAQLGYEPQTWAELIALSQVLEGAKGEVPAAREIRQATEGDTLNVSKMSDDEILEGLRSIAARLDDSGGDVS